jgi:hypothetical protein
MGGKEGKSPVEGVEGLELFAEEEIEPPPFVAAAESREEAAEALG